MIAILRDPDLVIVLIISLLAIVVGVSAFALIVGHLITGLL